MGEREQAVAERLVTAESLTQVKDFLFSPYVNGPYDVEEVLAELRTRRQQLWDQGRPAEAELVDFFTDLVAANRHEFERLRQAREMVGDRLGPFLPPGIRPPESMPRMVQEQRMAELTETGDLDQAVLVARQATGTPPSSQTEAHYIALFRMKLAGKLREVGRSAEALDVLAEFTPIDGGNNPYPEGKELPSADRYILFGLLHEDLGDYRVGRLCYEAALHYSEIREDTARIFRSWTSLAFSYSKSGRYREAIRESRRLVEFLEKKSSLHVVAALNNLGSELHGNGKLDEARFCYFRALSISRATGLDGGSVCTAWFGIGNVARKDGAADAALAAYTEGFESAVVGGHVRTGVQRVALALRSPLPGDDQLFETALGQYAALTEEGEDWTLSVTARIAIARRTLHQPGGVQEGTDKLRALCADAVGKGHFWRMITAYELADALISEHGEETQPGAAQEAFDVVWGLRNNMAASPETADREEREVHSRLITLLLDHGRELRLPDSRTPMELAFDLHEEACAHPFLRHLTKSPVPPPDGIREPLVREEAALLSVLTNPSSSPLDQRAATARLADLHEDMSAAAPEYVRLRQGRPARFADVRRYLRSQHDADNMAFVSFFCDRKSTVIFTYVPATDRLTTERIPLSRGDLATVARYVRDTFDGTPDDFPPRAPLHPRRPWRRDLSRLGELTPLVSGFLRHTAGRDLLLVSGDRSLSELPLSAVPTSDGSPLVSQHAILHVASASAMLHAPSSRHHGQSLIGAEVLCAGVAAHEDPVPERLERDAEMLAAAGWQVNTLTGVQATRQAVLEALGVAGIAHITCHGYFDQRNPLDSGLLLAQGGRRPSKLPQPAIDRLAHLLTARDFTRAALATQLLTLRACATGQRDDNAAGDLEGLVEALLYAGVRNVVASLWNVDETSSRRLLIDFYADLRANPGQPLWQAFWNSQKRMLTNPEEPWEAHPYHWAALALFGYGTDHRRNP
ncbi:CHAT domain-containing tetratricopeptide repeat protein [Streptomyces sp. NPDC001815]|uniref:CHAT domain-containing protein n=1 Tax=Streptomyces sp. NPDC001815 TaxID=3154526 RepID=UPI00331F456F